VNLTVRVMGDAAARLRVDRVDDRDEEENGEREEHDGAAGEVETEHRNAPGLTSRRYASRAHAHVTSDTRLEFATGEPSRTVVPSPDVKAG
jgi:hypothetical protein